MKYYIKERHNPQLGIYYIPCGQLSKKNARAKEDSLYGSNVMLEFENRQEYDEKLNELRKKGLLK